MNDFSCVFRIGFQDTDSTGRVYFPSYVRWFDMAFIEFLRQNKIVFDKVGHLVVDGKNSNTSFVIGEYGCRIEKPSCYDDLVEASIESAEIRNKSIKIFFRLENNQHEVLAKGFITYVYVDTEQERAAELPVLFREIFKTFLDNSSPKT